MGRSLADLAALATDPNLDPFERMCHAATLTNRAHATTAALARTCAVRARRPWRTWGTFWPCQRGTWAAWLAGSNCALVALAERRRAPRAWRRPGRCSLRCAPLRAALPFGAAVVVQTPASIAQFDRPRTSTGAFIRAWVRLNIPRPIPRTRRTEPDQNDLGRRDCPVCGTLPTL